MRNNLIPKRTFFFFFFEEQKKFNFNKISEFQIDPSIKLIGVDFYFPLSSDKVKVLLGDDVISFFYFLSKVDFIERKPPQLEQDHSPIPIYIGQNFVSNRYGSESNKKSTRALHSTKCFYDNVRSKTIRKKEVVCL